MAAHETIRYLLVQGHLDEDYADYLGHFYGHAIGSEDMKLIFALRQGKECDVAATIKAPEKFVKKLRPRNVDRGRGFIAELVLYLARAYLTAPAEATANDLVRILDDAPAYPQRFIDVVDILIERHDESAFLQAVFKLRSMLFALMLRGPEGSIDGPKPSHVAAILTALDLAQLEQLDSSDAAIKEHIQALSDASSLVAKLDPLGDGWLWMKSAGVRFHRLSPTTEPEVLSALLVADALSPTLSMLRMVALNGEPPTTLAAPVTVSRLLTADRLKGVDAFVATHMPSIVARLLEQDVALDETPSIVLMALKGIESNGAMAHKYFDKTRCSFPTLEALPPAFWDNAMRGDRLDNPAAAVRSYEALRPRIGAGGSDEVDEDTIRVILGDYASRHSEQLSQALWTGDDADERLQEWIITDPRLDDATILSLLSHTVVTSPALLSEAVSDERLNLLIQHGQLAVSEEIWTAVAARPLETQVAYLAPKWDAARLTPIKADLAFAVAARLDEDRVLSIEDALEIFAAMDPELLGGAPALIGSLADRAAAVDLDFPPTLMDVAVPLLTSGEGARWRQSLLVQAMPVLTWPQASAALRTLGGDLAKVGAGRSVDVDPAEGVRPLLEALKARGFASSLTQGKRGTRVNLKKKR